jgi:hypothetical protein
MSTSSDEMRPRSWAATLLKRVVGFAASDSRDFARKSRHQLAATTPVVWTGKLNVECNAHWLGMSLHAKEVTRTHWWWSVHDDETGSVIMDSRMTYLRTTTGKKARQAAEQAARQFLADHEDDGE